ncbi:MAG TPA: BON domain-containing protein [Blastocatellia bacterium]|nr:BON domain-containing protein [Blastocatellia bacterium]
MRKLIAVVIVLIIVGGAGYYIYTHGWKKPESFRALFSSSGDPDTSRKVKTALGLSKRLSRFDINVTTGDGVATLTGQVPSEDIKSLAGEIARDTAGVKDVKNEISVDPAAQPSTESVHVEDLEIRVAILEALARSRELGGKNIDVKVENRSVTLSGSVETPTQRNGAEQIARAVDGVAGVTNNLVVTNPQAASEPPAANAPPADSNAELAKRVEFELYRTNAFNTSTMQVRAEDGAVTLAGGVRSRAEQLLAERVVQSVSGVKKVTNELKVTASAAKQ